MSPSTEKADLKRKFLDRLAEIISRERRHPHISNRSNRKTEKSKIPDGGELDGCESFVACNTLCEYVDHVEIYVTRNNGLDEKDLDFFMLLKTMFLGLSSPNGMFSNSICGASNVLYHRQIS